jgi:hypothetical protein
MGWVQKENFWALRAAEKTKSSTTLFGLCLKGEVYERLNNILQN